MEELKHNKMEESIPIPSGVEVSVEHQKVTVKGKNGSMEKALKNPFVTIKKENNAVVLTAPTDVRKYKRMLYTIRSHINNMMKGAQEGYTYKLKICSGHFPITVKVEGQQVVVTNFLGEKIPRKCKILPDVKVKIDKDTILVQSHNVESAGQTAANIEQLTGVGKRDRRAFQDGCYIIEKPGRVFI
jgi:large subunit ribosomal protein L6